jgi:hypothetical protein
MSLEFVTSTEFTLANDAIQIFVFNSDELPGSVRIFINQNNVGGAVLFADTGVLTVAPIGTAIVGVTLLGGGFFGVKIIASSNLMVPNVEFARVQGGQVTVFAAYKPGDFATFERVRR